MPPLTLTLPDAPADRVSGILAILGDTGANLPKKPGQVSGVRFTRAGSPYAMACTSPGRVAFRINANVADTRQLAKAARSIYAIIRAQTEERNISLNKGDESQD
jgi:hypothetical protein